jgi:hypothetical protein
LNRFDSNPNASSSGPYKALAPVSAAVPWIAGMMVAVDPILLRQASLVMTETAAAFLSVLIWWLWIHCARASDGIHPKSALILGSLMGLSCLLRPSTLVWSPLLIAAIFIHRYRFKNPEPRVAIIDASAISLFAMTLLVLVPWAVRNSIVMGSTIWTTTHGGYTLLLANNPILFQHFEIEGSHRTWDDERFHALWSQRRYGDPREAGFWRGLNLESSPSSTITNEITDDRLAKQTAWATITRSPMIFVKACWIRIVWLWACWPAPGQASLLLEWLIGGWYCGTFWLFVYGSWRGLTRWWSGQCSDSAGYVWLPAVSLIVGLTAVHMIYWSNMRMRAPLIPFIAVIAAISLGHLASLGFRLCFKNIPLSPFAPRK